MTVLSREPDGMGFFYGYFWGHRIDVRAELPAESPNGAIGDVMIFAAYVDGERIGSAPTKGDAERDALAHIKSASSLRR